MAIVKPFVCIRPVEALAAQVAALPYDVYNRKEAREAVKDHPLSFLNMDRPETQFPDDTDMYDPKVYEKAKELLKARLADHTYLTDEDQSYYLYQLTMDGRSQTGIVACCSIDDYVSGVIKKHENTREEKEQDRIRHVDVMNAQTGPIFLAYRQNEVLGQIMEQVMLERPLYDFVSEDGIGHSPGVDHHQREGHCTDHGAFRPDGSPVYCRRPSPCGLCCEGGLKTPSGEPGLYGRGTI